MTSNRSMPYPRAPFEVVVPDHIWDATLREVARYRTSRSEALMFWGGVVAVDSVAVTGLYLPVHTPQGARVALIPEESRWLLRRLQQRDEKLVAQVHSHPGAAYHSHGDDRHATSYHPGAYSIVIPDYGIDVRSPFDCAIYVHDGHSFRLLDSTEVARLVSVAIVVEQRRPVSSHADPAKQPGRWWQKWPKSK